MNKILEKKIIWGGNIELTIASKLYNLDIYKVCFDKKKNRSYHMVYSASETLQNSNFVVLLFDDKNPGAEHYSVLQP